ncbi:MULTISPECIES: hypothetical protein [Burkholderiaceae]|uniref:hypothetical protein n=1 Tax=Burkholderiaceae TaxID=119060 RepID=UPI00078751C5|nr:MULTISPECIES: hypothetical protein [Burkholderiaceae]MBR7924155.1 hypothetical protein [Burkholderia multivorans]MCA8336187.1 hypothetical protein [Burkholderia multivorans]
MHYIDEYRREFQQHSTLDVPRAQHATDLANWLKTRGIQLFKDAFQQETSQSVPNLPDEKLIEQAYPKSLNEIEKKQAQQAFYSSNAKIFAEICSWIAEAVANANASDPRSEVFASQHYSLLRNMALDAQVLLDDWAALTQKTPAMYGIGKNPFHDSFQISHATQQLMFGGSSLFAFTDLATDSGTALLRVALETRIRFGFGLLGVLDLSNQTVLPLNMSTILEAIKLHESKFKLAIPLQHIERIYGWSNIYVHIGLKHFTWSPIFALKYLTPLLRGGNYPGGTGVNAGIYIDKATLLDIQKETENAYQLDPTKYKLVTIPPEQCSAILKP